MSDAGAATPPPPGRELPELGCFDGVTWSITSDAASSRVFLPVEGDRWGVMTDDLPAYRRPAAFDPDQGAADVPEAAGKTESTFGAQAGAYGERVVIPGGPIGIFDNLTPGGNFVQNLTVGAGLNFQPSSRDLRLANIPVTKLGTDGVEAIATSADRDARFDADLAMLQQWHGGEREQLRALTCGPSPSPEPAPSGSPSPSPSPSTGCTDTSHTPTWPFDYSHCYAFGGNTDQPTDTKDGSSATCYLKQLKVDATAHAEKPFSTDVRRILNGLAPIITVGEANASTSLMRDPTQGTVAKSSATARNIVINGALGTIYITEATSTAIARAAGHHGTASTTFPAPEFRGVKITGPDGAELFGCEVCVPSSVVDEMNQVLGPRIIARLPVPDDTFLKGSKLGTYASVEQDFWQRTEEQALFDKPADDLTTPALELRINTNVLASSGYVVQLAGVSAVASYRISKLPELLPPPPIQPPVTITKVFPPPPLPNGGTGPTTKTITTQIVEKVRSGVRWVM
ncbi:MAG: hypothetical protein LC750_04865, partial [Actinobacteria bacterium]|nr:hypothetical protein [Actinomycetota bacterium]